MVYQDSEFSVIACCSSRCACCCFSIIDWLERAQRTSLSRSERTSAWCNIATQFVGIAAFANAKQPCTKMFGTQTLQNSIISRFGDTHFTNYGATTLGDSWTFTGGPAHICVLDLFHQLMVLDVFKNTVYAEHSLLWLPLHE